MQEMKENAKSYFFNISLALTIEINSRYHVKPSEILRDRVSKNRKSFYSSSISHVVFMIFNLKLMQKNDENAKSHFFNISLVLTIEINSRYLVKPSEILRDQVSNNKKPFYSSSISHVGLKIFNPKLMQKNDENEKKPHFKHKFSACN
jgi:hypothetical protein